MSHSPKQLVPQAVDAIEKAKPILLTAILAQDFHDSFVKSYNYPTSAILAYICKILIRIIPEGAPEIFQIRDRLLDEYNSISKSWNTSPLATVRALDALNHISSKPHEEISQIFEFLLNKADDDGTWKAELPHASDPVGDSRFCTSEILMTLTHFSILPSRIEAKAIDKFKQFFDNIKDQELLSYHTAYTAVPLYNLFMIGAIDFDHHPYEELWLRFLVDLNFFRDSRKREDTVLETLYVLKLLLRTALLCPYGKIDEAISWLFEVRVDDGWNRKAFDPPSSYVTAKVVDIFCDYIEFHKLRQKANGYLSGVFPSHTTKPADQEKSTLAAVWDTIDWKIKIPGIGIGVDIKKLLKT